MKRILVSAVVSVAVVAATLALWELRTLLVLLVLVTVLAAAIHPGVELLSQHGIPRAVGVLAHYTAAAAVVAAVIWLVVPPLVSQLESAARPRPAASTAGGLGASTVRQLVESVEQKVRQASVADVAEPAFSFSQQSLRIIGGIAFVLAAAAYWTLDRDRAQRVLTRRLSGERRRRVLASWQRVEQRLGAYVRGQLLLMGIVASVLSVAFWLIGLPYWLAIGIFAAVAEIIPIVGPLFAGVVAVGVGLTVSWQTAALAGASVYGLRLVQDYVLVPRIMGHAAGIPPLATLIWVSFVGIVFGPACVPIATPLACILVASFERAENS